MNNADSSMDKPNGEMELSEKNTEKLMQKNPIEYFHELAIDSTNQLITLSDLETEAYVEVNKAFLDTLGYTREDIIGKTSEDIQLYVDLVQSKRYLKLLSRLNKVRDLEIKLRLKSGDVKPFLFSARTIFIGDQVYLITFYNDISALDYGHARAQSQRMLKEVFDTMSSYVAIFRYTEDNKIFVFDFNSRAEEVEQLDRDDVIGKEITETPLINNRTLLALLDKIVEYHGTQVMPVLGGNRDESGYYLGFTLSSEDIVVTFEAGQQQKIRENGILKQGMVFETFAELLPEMIMEIDLAGKISFINTQGMMTLGFNDADIEKGINIADLIHISDAERLMKDISELTKPGQITVNEYLFVSKQNKEVSVLFHAGPMFKRKQLSGYRCVLTDVSKHKEYEHQLSNEKAMLEHLIDAAPEAIVLTDFDGRVLRVNRGFSQLFGYTPEEVHNHMIEGLIVPEENRSEANRAYKEAFLKGTEAYESVRLDKFGNKIDVALTISSVVSSEQNIAFLCIYRDISQEKKSRLMQEIQYNISSVALQDFDLFNIYPAIVKEISRLWNVNNFFIALYNPEKDTLSFPFFADELDHFQETPAKNTLTGWVIKNNKAMLLDENDILQIEKTGAISLVGSPCKIWMGVPLRIEDEVIGAICLQDYKRADAFNNDDLQVFEFIANQMALTMQRRRMLDNLITARKRAEEAALSKQQFMSTMSHEIRTPLNEVIGITNLLYQGNPSEEQMELLKTLRFSANHLLTLVNDILDYNKMEAGKIVFEKTEFDLSSMLDDIKRTYSLRANDKGIGFSIEKSNDLPSQLIGDTIRLNQILSNLLSNAMKFTLSGSVTLSASLKEIKNKKALVEFAVADTGIGIPENKLEDVFESFTQAAEDTTRKFGGTGLGLAICKRLVDLQGGKISVRSTLGKGSVFTFSIEYAIPEATTKAADQTISDQMKGLQGKKILIAEDNKINFFVAKKFLESWGVIVTHVENGSLALDAVKAADFDLVIMDLHMPVMDGIEATRIIRSSPEERISQIPIVALTAAVMSEAHDKIENLAINDIVLKPFKPKDLYDRLVKNVR